jgi:hypothetical protein
MPPESSKPTMTGPWRADQLKELDNLRKRVSTSPITEAELVGVVAQALAVAGAKPSSGAHANRREQPDIVAWFPNAPTDLGSAVLIEVKSTVANEPQKRHAINQVAQYMAAADIRAGLLLARDFEEEIEVHMVPSGYLFVASIETLLDLISRGRLTKGLVEARNRFVHLAS